MKGAKARLEFGITIRGQLEDCQRFICCFDFSLPAVNRVNWRENISARGQFTFDELAHDFSRRLGVGKGTEREDDFVGHHLSELQGGCAANPSTTDHDVAIVDNSGLSRRDRLLRLVELNAGASIV